MLAGGDRSVLSPGAYKLYRIRKTVCAMLSKRGYVVLEDDLNMKVEDFASTFGGDVPSRERMSMLVFKRDDEADKLFVFYPAGDVGVPQCKDFVQRMYKEGVKRAILVISGKFSNFAKQTLAEVSADLVIEHFLEAELLVDITEHELVPQHVVLNEEEKAALLARYKLKESQLPRIQLGDPVARFFGMQRGQVVKIIRPSETAGRYVTYRIVV